MTRLLLIAGVAALIALLPPTAAAQGVIEFNLCNLAWFPNDPKRDEYRALIDKLSLFPPYRDALALRTKVSAQLASRLSRELSELWARMQTSMASSVGSPEAAEAQTVLVEQCLNRLRREPEQEIAVVRTEIETVRSLLALSESEFEKQFRARMERFQNALGTPEAANQTLRINLGLPVAH
jgi:hypothetical protein